MTVGSDSGTAATIRLIAATITSSHGWPRNRPWTATSRQSPTATAAMTRLSPLSRRCRGVSGVSTVSKAASRPVALSRPVAEAITRARPRTTTVPAETIRAAGSAAAGLLSTGTDSPVRLDSSTRSAADSITSPSAATRSPSASTSRSPGTTAAAGICSSAPSRITRACGALRSLKAVMALSARISCTTPTVVFTTITAVITAASTRSPSSRVRTTPQISRMSSGSRT